MTLLKHADSAMYLAKKEGRNNFQFFDEALESQTERYMLIQQGLHNALKLGELSIHYQPKYELRQRKIVGAEALLRWHSPLLGVGVAGGIYSDRGGNRFYCRYRLLAGREGLSNHGRVESA